MKHPSRARALRALLAVFVVSTLTLTGCKRFYRVTDRETGDVFYTDHLDRRAISTSDRLQFVDEATGAVITLKEYEYQKIRRRAYQNGVESSRRATSPGDADGGP